jgi:Helix-hairpin-helix domain
MREGPRGRPDLPQSADDALQKIAGIGPTVAARLAQAGISRYRELAALTPERLADLAGVGPGKVTGQDWIGQARRLAGDVSTGSEQQQEYVTFHVELLIDDGAVRRTKTRHYQTDTEENWSGWDAERLIAVIRRKAALDSAAPVPHPAKPSRSPTPSLQVDGPHPAEEGTHGTFRLAGQPTVVRMTIQVATGAADFAAEINADSLRDRSRQSIATATGTVTASQSARLELTGPPLPPGMHRLEAAITVFGHRHQPADEPTSRRRVLGDLIHVTAAPARHASDLASPVVERTRPL